MAKAVASACGIKPIGALQCDAFIVEAYHADKNIRNRRYH